MVNLWIKSTFEKFHCGSQTEHYSFLWLEEVLARRQLLVHFGLWLRGREGRVRRLLLALLQRLLPLRQVPLLELGQDPLPVLVPKQE